MALPASGQITYAEIWNESDIPASPIDVQLYGTSDMITYYNKVPITTNVSPTYFYGITWDSVILSLGSVTTTSSTSQIYNAYRTINRTGQDSNSTGRVRIYYTATPTPSNGHIYYYYSINSTSTWVNFFSTTSSVSTTYYTIPYTLAYNDVLRFRVYGTHDPYYSNSGTMYIDSTSPFTYYSGGGSTSRTTTYNWNWSG